MISRTLVRVSLWMVGMAALLVWATLGGVFGYSPDAVTYNNLDKQPNLYAHDLGTGVQLSLVPIPDLYVSSYAWSPDGRTLAFVSGGQGSRSLYVRSEWGSITNIGNYRTNGGPYWSPDGRHLVIVYQDRLELVDVVTAERLVIELQGDVELEAQQYVPVADAVVLMEARVPSEDRVGLFRINLYTGQFAEAEDNPCDGYAPRAVALSPNGMQMIYGCFQNPLLYIRDVSGVAGSSQLIPLADTSLQYAPAWGVEGRRAIFARTIHPSQNDGSPYSHYIADLHTGDYEQILNGQVAAQVQWFPPRGG